jgi:hypothetical protein
MNQVRPVAFDDPAHLWIDRFDGVELLNLLPDGFQLLWFERASLVKWRATSESGAHSHTRPEGVTAGPLKESWLEFAEEWTKLAKETEAKAALEQKSLDPFVSGDRKHLTSALSDHVTACS